MSPSCAALYRTDYASRNTYFLGDYSVRPWIGSNTSDNGVCEFSLWAIFTKAHSPFGYHIGCVLLSCRGEQMCWIYAVPYIAMVAYKMAAGYFPMKQLIAVAMRKAGFGWRNSKNRISASIDRAFPAPASIFIFSNETMEPYFRRFWDSERHAKYVSERIKDFKGSFCHGL